MTSIHFHNMIPDASGAAWVLARITVHIPPEHRVWWGSLVAAAAAVAIVIFGLLSWNVVMHFAGGWRSLAKHYRAAQPLTGVRVVVYGAVGRMAQNHLAFSATETGLFLSRIQFFDFLNKPLFIPSEDFHSPAEGKSYTADRMIALRIGQPLRGRLLLPAHVLERSPASHLVAKPA